MTEPTKLASTLAALIKAEFGLTVEPVIYRVYAGHWQRSMGAWSWFMTTKPDAGGLSVGSQWTANTVASAKVRAYLESGMAGVEIVPDDMIPTDSPTTVRSDGH